MQVIPLTKGYEAKVDDDDYGWLSSHKWTTQDSHGYLYAMTTVRGHCLLMHNIILGVIGVDHINRDGLDNQRANLRPASKQENARNSGLRSDNKTGFKGVSFASTGNRVKRWRASIHVDGKNIHLGHHATPEDAARAYDNAAREMFGEFARTNFTSL